MRRLFWQMMISLDGFMEGPNSELDWHAIDEDFDRYGREMLASIDGMLLGRKTYQLFASHWPTSTQSEAPRLNELPKHVFSRTLERVEWNNSTLVRSDAVEAVQRLKQQPGRELALFGSAELASTLMRAGLIDEYRIMVAPIVLGSGAPMFKHVEQRVRLRLTRSETFSSGVVSSYYEPM